MGTLSAALAAPPKKRRRWCGLADWAATLDADDKAAVNDAVTDTAWSVEALTQALNGNGFRGGRNVVANHRRKACACYDVG